MRRYLILEDDDSYFQNTYEATRRDQQDTEAQFEIVHAKTVDEAFRELGRSRFTGAILDLHLASDGHAGGNLVAKKIHSDYLMPTAVVTGFIGELGPDLQELADKQGFFRLFNKNEGVSNVFQFLNSVETSGVLQMIGPGGELTQIISEIFWKHLGSVITNWNGRVMETNDRRRVLRHTVSHMIGTLQSKEDGDWDNFLPEEVYI